LRTEGDEPALPVPVGYFEGHPGMSMREWYAGRALQGIVSNPSWNAHYMALVNVPEECSFAIAAKIAYRYADAMLAEGAKGGRDAAA
jgi:hypothetical protein